MQYGTQGITTFAWNGIARGGHVARIVWNGQFLIPGGSVANVNCDQSYNGNVDYTEGYFSLSLFFNLFVF